MASWTCVVFSLYACIAHAILIKPNEAEWPSSLGACSSDTDCSKLGEHLRCCPVGENVTDPGGCPTTLKAKALTEKHVSVCQFPSAQNKIQRGICGCAMPARQSCTDGPPSNWPYKRVLPGYSKQWLIIGDSISQGIVRHVRILGTAKDHGVQIVHIPRNSLNSRYGKRCVKDWIGDPDRWDLISFNFGLHDMSHNTERLEPEQYGDSIRDIAKEIRYVAPRAVVLFATTTAVPRLCGSTSKCAYAADNFPKLSGVLLRQAKRLNDTVVYEAKDPAIYNAAAAKALAKLPKVQTVDLYKRVVDACGESFETCPKDCHKNKNINEDCYSYPGDVHFTRRGYLDLAAAYTDAVLSALKLGVTNSGARVGREQSLVHSASATADPSGQENALLIVPGLKLAFCFIPKNACTQFNQLMNVLNDLPNPRGKNCKADDPNWKSSAIWNFGWTEAEALRVVTDPTWFKAVFLRDPLSRLVSAFRSKCELKECRGDDCLADDFNDTVDMLTNTDNIHYTPQSTFCGGLAETIDSYDFVGHISADFEFVNNQVKQMLHLALEHYEAQVSLQEFILNKNILRKDAMDLLVDHYFTPSSVSDRSEEFFSDFENKSSQSEVSPVDEFFPPDRNGARNNHVTSTADGGSEYYTAQAAALALQYYSEDYDRLPGLRVPAWAKRIAAQPVSR